MCVNSIQKPIKPFFSMAKYLIHFSNIYPIQVLLFQVKVLYLDFLLDNVKLNNNLKNLSL